MSKSSQDSDKMDINTPKTIKKQINKILCTKIFTSVDDYLLKHA